MWEEKYWDEMVTNLCIEHTMEFPYITADTAEEKILQYDVKHKEIQDHRKANVTRRMSNPDSNVAVFLDIDGVVSPLPRQEPYRFLVDDLFTYVMPDVPIRETVRKWIIGEHGCRFLWSSSWGTSASNLSDAMGGGPEETIITHFQSKRRAMQDYLNEHPEITHVILCEDDPYDFEGDVNVTYITTDENTGLTDKDLDRIDRLVEEFKEQ